MIYAVPIIVLVLVLALAWALAWFSFRRRARDNKAALLEGSKIIQTSVGPIEVAVAGSGTPVLISHGGAGGYDQGLKTASAYLGPGLKAIAPSRFGHLRTPLASDSSAGAQADAYSAVLDALDIEAAAIVGVSGGGPSALQFALRHPDRCVALVLSAAVSRQLPARSVGVYASDLGFWLATTLLRSTALAKIGVSAEKLAAASAGERRLVNSIMDEVHPVSMRRPGLLHDIQEWADERRWAEDYPLEKIRAPTLVVHAVDDGVVPFSHGENAAERIPGARLISLPGGGHLRIGHGKRLREEITRFIHEHS